MKMEILLEPTSNKLMVEHAEFNESNAYVLERFYNSAGNPIKEILLKLNLPDHRILKDGGEVEPSKTEYINSEEADDTDEEVESKKEVKEETKGEPEKEEEDDPEHFDTFPTMKELRLYLMRRSLEVLRKFHWMILGGRFNQLSHVSSPLLSKPREY
ncbi:hypothetical protein Tco_0925203 [Tanacetum coccineum]|uniref:Uncharacterized protein n=1 Tax=Tanacetum coccineum TaxID=301880 RepID=A0ABQ5DCC4_9ASTR